MNSARARARLAYSPIAYEVDDSEYFDRDDALSQLRTRIAEDLGADRLDVPPLPNVALELNKLANSPDADLRRAGKLIQRDAQLAGRVVKAACSPAFGGRPVQTLDAAASRLGTNGLRNVAMAAAMGRVLRSGPLVDVARDVLRHSFVVAAATHHACRSLGADRQHGFLCGLFHDVGRLIIAIALGSYAQSDERLAAPAFVAYASDELHEPVGGLVLSQWGLHNTVKRVAAHHHEPAQAGEAAPIACLVAIADAADRVDAADAQDRYTQLVALPVAGAAGLAQAQLFEICETVEAARADDVLTSLIG